MSEITPIAKQPFNGTDRTGLYIMVFLILIASCRSTVKLGEMETKVNNMERIIKARL